MSFSKTEGKRNDVTTHVDKIHRLTDKIRERFRDYPTLRSAFEPYLNAIDAQCTILKQLNEVDSGEIQHSSNIKPAAADS